MRTIVTVTAVIDTPRQARHARIGEAAAGLARRAADHAKTTAHRLSGSVLTAAGLACIDVGCFEGNTIAGWIVTGATVLLLDWKLEGSGSGEQP